MTKQKRLVEFLNKTARHLNTSEVYYTYTSLPSTFEVRTVYHNSVRYYIRTVGGHRRTVTRTGKRFSTLGVTVVR